MSEVVTVGTGSETIYGTFSGAKAFVDIMYGPSYDAWVAADDNTKKKTLAVAARFINSFTWLASADTFAERDALQAFVTASYEMAVLVFDDPTVTAAIDSGLNVRSVTAGGAGVEYFAAAASKLPPVLQRLVGVYLAP